MANIDFSHTWPFNEIREQTVDGQAMVYIPKIYVNNTKLTKGKYAGKWQYSISGTKLDSSWHVHPAFMNNGVEMSGIQIGAYIASKDSSGKAASIKGAAFWTSINFADSQKAAKSRNVNNGTKEQKGWHMLNVYEAHLVNRLMLIEYGTTNLLPHLKGSNADPAYRGINILWGGSKRHWFDGIDTKGSSNTTIRIFDNQGNQTWVDTGAKALGGNWVTDVLHNTNAKFDLGDIFIASAASSSQASSTLGDYQNIGGGKILFSPVNGDTSCGPFFFNAIADTYSDSTIGFRLARYVE